jgi:ribosomal protein S30
VIRNATPKIHGRVQDAPPALENRRPYIGTKSRIRIAFAQNCPNAELLRRLVVSLQPDEP